MRLRRCAILFVTPTERLDFNLATLATGGTGVEARIEWIGLAPHLETQLTLTLAEIAALGEVSPLDWSDVDRLSARHPPGLVDSLIASGLLLREHADTTHNHRDEALRAMHWRALDALVHRYSRWHQVDTVEAQRFFAAGTGPSFLDRLGPCPPPVRECRSASADRALPRPIPTPLDALCERRVTCRNYDTERVLDFEDFGAVMFRTFGARAVDDYAPGVTLLKKSTPSAGGLHPVGVYVLARQVAGVEPGLYHYHPIAHALEPLLALDAGAAENLATRFLGGQTYFAQAHAVVVLAARFRRNFWKYRNHAKAYRSIVLDAGHLSQMLYLAATELGLGAFITAGVNELDIEKALDLDPMEEGVLAGCGFGHRGRERNEVEFDPLRAVWPATHGT